MTEPKTTRQPSPRVAQQMLNAQMLSMLRAMQNTQTQFAAGLAGNIINNVVATGVQTISALGTAAFDSHTGLGSVEIENLGTHAMTVQVGADTTGTPGGDGRGRRIIPAGANRIHNLGGQHGFVVYGTAGDQYNYQVFSDSRGGQSTGGL